MESMKTPFISTNSTLNPSTQRSPISKPCKNPRTRIYCCVNPSSWSLSDGNKKNFKRNPRKRSSADDARRINHEKARNLRAVRRSQGFQAQTPKWIQRTPEQMVQYLKDDRDSHLYGKHVVAAIKIVRNLSTKAEGSYDMRQVMGSFITKLTFREMCVVLKEQKGWRQVRDFFHWMKLQLSYRASVNVYTIVLHKYGEVGKIKLAEQVFLEMLEAGCEADGVACGTMLCAYARWGHHKAMLQFYSVVRERGIVPPVAVFNFMISSLQKKSLHKEVIQLWRQMVDAGVSPNDFTYTVAISSYVKEGLLEGALETFRSMKESGFIPQEVTYSILISLSAKHANQDEALKLYHDLRSHGIVPSNYTCASLLNLHYRNGDYPKALALFSEMEKSDIVADEVIYGLLIRIYGKLGLREDAQKTFDEVGQLGLLNDEKTYVSMAQVHINAGDFDKALDTLELMTSRKICFSRFGYKALLQSYSLKGDVGSAEATFLDLFRTGQPDASSCKDMLNLYMRLGLLEKAKAFIVQLKRVEFQFDEHLYKAVIELYCKHGMLRDAEQLIEEMRCTALVKNTKFAQTSLVATCQEPGGHEKPENTFEALDQLDNMALEMLLCLYMEDGDTTKTNRVLTFLLQNSGGLSVASQLITKSIREGNISKAEFLDDQIVKLGYRPEDGAISSMINLYGRLQQLKQAQEVFERTTKFSASVRHLFNSMIEAYAMCGEPEEIYWLYKEIINKGGDLTAVMISKIVNVLSSYGKYQVAETIIRKSFQDEVKLDTVAYNTFIKAILEGGKMQYAASIYGRMLSSGVPPSIQTYNTMISVYGQGRKLEKAVEIFNTAKSLGISIDEKAYTNMISYYGKAGMYKEASNLFIQMQEEGINPGKVSYNVMMNVYATVGLDDEAEKLLETMQKNGCSPDSFTYLALIRAYTENQNYLKAKKTLFAMQKEGIFPSGAHYNQLLFGFAKAGLTVDAEKVYRELMEAGLSPDLACHRTMLRGYLDYGHVVEGISFFEQINKSAESDKLILSAAVHLYKSAGLELKARDVLDSMNARGVSFLENLKVGSKSKAV